MTWIKSHHAWSKIFSTSDKADHLARAGTIYRENFPHYYGILRWVIYYNDGLIITRTIKSICSTQKNFLLPWDMPYHVCWKKLYAQTMHRNVPIWVCSGSIWQGNFIHIFQGGWFNHNPHWHMRCRHIFFTITLILRGQQVRNFIVFIFTFVVISFLCSLRNLVNLSLHRK